MSIAFALSAVALVFVPAILAVLLLVWLGIRRAAVRMEQAPAAASGAAPTPLEKAKEAAAAMSVEDMREFRRWLAAPDAPAAEPYAPRPNEGVSRGQSGITS
jgi:hypothetical protein